MGQYLSGTSRPRVNEQFLIDTIFEDVDDAMKSGRWIDIDRALSSIDIHNTQIEILIVWLTATGAGRKHLNSRAKFYNDVAQYVTSTGNNEDGALLYGLE